MPIKTTADTCPRHGDGCGDGQTGTGPGVRKAGPSHAAEGRESGGATSEDSMAGPEPMSMEPYNTAIPLLHSHTPGKGENKHLHKTTSHVPNDTSVEDGPHVRKEYHGMITELKSPIAAIVAS